jgi:type-F conjugative transfer system pilin assembly protein TrbC
MKKLLVVVVFTAQAISAFAQNSGTPNMPNQNTVEDKRKEVMEALKSMAPNQRSQGMQMNSNGAAISALDALSGAGLPISKSTQADFMNLARPGSGSLQQGKSAPAATSSDLMIFVSMSMPELMLQQYAVQAKRFNAVLMMRGFVADKMSTTKEVLLRLNAAGAQWEISPEPFTTFKIDKVPAIVLATAESASILEEGCAKPESYTVIFGDIPVSAALDKMALLGQKEIANMAKKRLADDRAAGKKQHLNHSKENPSTNAGV